MRRGTGKCLHPVPPVRRTRHAEAAWRPRALNRRRGRPSRSPVQPAVTPAAASAAAPVPAARACTSWVVSALPPIAQSPLCTSSSTHQVTPRMFSPSIDTIASVSFCTISRRCELEKTPSITLTLISGISHAPFPSCSCAAPVRLLSSTGLVPFTLGTLLSRYIRTTTDSNKLKYRPSRREETSRRELSMVVISRPATAACYAWRIRAADAGGALGEGKARPRADLHVEGANGVTHGLGCYMRVWALARSALATQITRFGCNPGDQAEGLGGRP